MARATHKIAATPDVDVYLVYNDANGRVGSAQVSNRSDRTVQISLTTTEWTQSRDFPPGESDDVSLSGTGVEMVLDPEGSGDLTLGGTFQSYSVRF